MRRLAPLLAAFAALVVAASVQTGCGSNNHRSHPSVSPATILHDGGGGVAYAPNGLDVASGSNNVALVWVGALQAPRPAVLTGRAFDEAVTAVAYAPDGRHLAGASEDDKVWVWDLRAPQAPPTILTGHTDAVNAVAYAPDGRHLASASDNTVRVWDIVVASRARRGSGQARVARL